MTPQSRPGRVNGTSLRRLHEGLEWMSRAGGGVSEGAAAFAQGESVVVCVADSSAVLGKDGEEGPAHPGMGD